MLELPQPLPDLAGVVPTVHHIPAGGALFRRTDPASAIFRLASGKIRLLRVTADGAQVPVHSARSGELFAEAALFSPRYHCDAIAASDSIVLAYAKAELARRLREDEGAMWAFTADLAHRIQGLRTRLEIRHIRSASERILQALRLRVDAQGCWLVDGTLKQFAEEIGLTHEALYRALAQLEEEGRIARQDRRLCLL